MKSAHQRTYELLDKAREGDRLSVAVDASIMALIVANAAVVTLETVRGIESAYHDAFVAFERFSLVVFSTEYLLRLWACTANERFRAPVTGRLRYALTPLAIVDLLAIAPSLFSLFGGVDLRSLRIIRLLRYLRLLKFGRYSASMQLLGRSMMRAKDDLAVAVLIMLLLLVFTSTLVYYAEHEAQPERYSSIPATMWWAMATLTTVGYGDIYPVTVLGKMLGGVVAVLGVGMFALPTAIVSGSFMEELNSRKKGEQSGGVCPHCGKALTGQAESME